jgi:peptidoglycan LD-endopeptidase CwlK
MLKHEEKTNGVDIHVVGCVEAIAEATEKELGRDVVVISGGRSTQEQAEKYAQGRTTVGKIITYAPPKSSPHEYYCALDFWVLSEDGKSVDWNNKEFPQIIDRVVSSTAGKITWGAKFKNLKDTDHVELTDWRAVRAGTKKIIPNTIA